MSDNAVPIRVAIVDDQELIRTGVKMIIDSQDDMHVAVEAADGQQALEKLRATRVDVVVMDVRMPRMDGVTATAHLQALPTPPKVLVLTTFDIDKNALAALKAGASGFLLKESRGEDIVEAIRHVHSGDAVIAPSTTKRLLDRLVAADAESTRRDDVLAALTERETDVFRAIATGQSNQEIAGALFLSETTVKTHVRSILRKLDLRDRVQIVITAYESGLMREA
ncbi:LuxR family two component transcriptional regulator [Antricoccus suffuscus]|uniref:LuxR family two component transcriptional regulator n=1 Tax=Antricoccus suffuscus TaxID=1629062 RepID=A0A2T1A3N4_9ACTN|nr:response regulator transcription factor [Antricoccus suffuscus]PRZ43212.1 LuxR family two component transcriptional regulator [Antricoccus suffuscus]